MLPLSRRRLLNVSLLVLLRFRGVYLLSALLRRWSLIMLSLWIYALLALIMLRLLTGALLYLIMMSLLGASLLKVIVNCHFVLLAGKR